MEQGLSRRQQATRIRALLREEGPNVKRQTQGFNEARYAATADLEGYEALKEAARAIKADAIERLPALIETLTDAVEANGGHVYFADTPADANRYVARIARDRGAEVVVKSKSMTTEEIGVNAHLADRGVDVYETDLGEFVIQVADESPSHLVGPAIHHSTASIARLFNEHFSLDDPLETAQELTVFARDFLGERMREADIGITGANFLLAESGTIVLVTNEGNARKCAALPDTHIAVAGVEKIIPSVSELQPFVELLARSATGQHISRYVTMLSPPVETPIPDVERDAFLDASGRAFHLVLLDNGRSAMREDPVLEEVLYCIRCSACLNACANFQSVGGHAFGGDTYTGGIGTGWEAGVEGLDSAAAFNDLCTGCSRCVNQCPVGIDIPWINTAMRSRITEARDDPTLDFVYEGLLPTAEGGGTTLRSRVFADFERIARLASATAPLSNWVLDSRLNRYLLDRVVGIDRRRDLPRVARRTLLDRSDPVDIAEADVVFFVDTYTNYVLVDRGLAALDLLDALDLAVSIPPVHATGREPYSQGMIATAEAAANDLVDHLQSAIDAEVPIIFVEPSDLAMVKGEYGRLLTDAHHRELAEQSVDIFEYLIQTVGLATIADRFEPVGGRSVFYHSHCQQRTLGLDVATIEVLERVGYDVTASTAECCGMAGSFGYKTEYYDLSMDVGETVRDQLEAAVVDHVVASGTSCLEQLRAFDIATVAHPTELVRPT